MSEINTSLSGLTSGVNTLLKVDLNNFVASKVGIKLDLQNGSVIDTYINGEELDRVREALIMAFHNTIQDKRTHVVLDLDDLDTAMGKLHKHLSSK